MDRDPSRRARRRRCGSRSRARRGRRRVRPHGRGAPRGGPVTAREGDVVDGEAEARHDRRELGPDGRHSVGHGHLPSVVTGRRPGSSQRFRSTKCVGTRPTLAWPLEAGIPDRWATRDLCVGEERGHYQTTVRQPGRKSPRVPWTAWRPPSAPRDLRPVRHGRVALRRLRRLRVLHDRSGGFVPMWGLRPRRDGADAARRAPRPLPARVRELLGPREPGRPLPAATATSAARPTSAGAPPPRRPHPRDRLRDRRRPGRARGRVPRGPGHRAQ